MSKVNIRYLPQLLSTCSFKNYFYYFYFCVFLLCVGGWACAWGQGPVEAKGISSPWSWALLLGKSSPRSWHGAHPPTLPPCILKHGLSLDLSPTDPFVSASPVLQVQRDATCHAPSFYLDVESESGACACTASILPTQPPPSPWLDCFPAWISHSLVCVDHIFFHLPIDWHWGCFHLMALMKNAAENTDTSATV